MMNIFSLMRFRRTWRKKNLHNTTIAANHFNINLVSVGKMTYGAIRVLTYNNNSLLSIGNYCSIAPEVVFILSADHNLDKLSTFPFKVKILYQAYEGVSKGDIIVDDDVWIGYRSIILSGVHIGQGAVIAAGSVVTKDVPPYAIVGGTPAKVIKFRFNADIIKKLRKIDYGNITREKIESNIDLLYRETTTENVDEIVDKLNN